MKTLIKSSFMSYVFSLWVSLIFRYVRSVVMFCRTGNAVIFVKCQVFANVKYNNIIKRITNCLIVKWEYEALMCLDLIHNKIILKSANR